MPLHTLRVIRVGDCHIVGYELVLRTVDHLSLDADSSRSLGDIRMRVRPCDWGIFPAVNNPSSHQLGIQ